MATHDRFNLAFENWRLEDLDTNLTLFRFVEYRKTGIKVTINRFYPFVSAYLSREGAQVVVEWNEEPYGKLFARDFEARRDPYRGWVSTLNEGAEEVEIEPIQGLEQLWRDGLFEPLQAFVQRSLFTADVLYMCEDRLQKWSLLSMADQPAPAAARLGVYPAGYS